MATVSDVLAKKGSQVFCVSPTASVLDATQLMNRHKVGALVVTVGPSDSASCERVVGMFTERDVLTRIVAEQRDPTRTLVEDVMTPDVAYCQKHHDLDEVSAMMRARRIRHLPVCDNGSELAGLISIGDINAWHADGLAATIHYLNEYIHGRI